ncbi:hypothetical protein FBZ87_11345 [Nitrospirillum amazonense]|uniref:Alpha/beta hydrolase family protein n=1 Tax=Nitrospirillum amazonense TaxID=28077 RepID=A0A560J9D2_9PROT|nr:hypothetical protein [Nitrospirillum amazonense]TWB67802.1 hypothetical protein FBZ87_11345 [Nitrospirillum amazonense]
MGYSLYGVMSKSPNWFPRKDMEGAIRVINSDLQQSRPLSIITYGHSQGGYAALRYSADLNAVAIASSPQYTIDPAKSEGMAGPYYKFFDSSLHEEMEIRREHVKKGSVFFYDPIFEEDSWHARKIIENSDATPILAPFTGHATILHLIDTGAIDSIFNSDQITIDAFSIRKKIRNHRGKSVIYWINRVYALSRNVDRFAGEIEHAARNAVKFASRSPEPRVELAKILYRTGRHEEAGSAISLAFTFVEEASREEVWYEIIELLGKIHGPKPALLASQLLVLYRPALIHAQFLLAYYLIYTKRFEEGRAILRQILSYGGHVSDRNQFLSLLLEAGMQAEWKELSK